MNDSREINENGIVTGTITCIINGEAKVAFDSQPGEGAVIPLSKLSGEIAVGNVVKLRLEKKGDNTVITEILSNKKPSTPSEAQQAVLSETDDKDVVEGIALAIENDDVLVNIGFNTDVKIPLSRFTDISVGDKVKMRVESVDGKIVVKEVISRTKMSVPKPENENKENSIVTGTIVAMIINDEVTVKYLDENGAAHRVNVPYAKLVEFDGKRPCCNDTVQLRLEQRGTTTVATEIISHESRYDDVPFDVESHETEKPVAPENPAESEHPRDDKPEDTNIKAKVANIEKEGEKTLVTLELLGDSKRIVADATEIGFEVEVGYILNLEVEENSDEKTIKAAQIHSKPQTVETEKPTENTETPTEPAKPEEDKIELRYIDKELMLSCMAVPTHSKMEYRMVTYIMMWARRNNVQYDFDDYGNIYLTKGELKEGEYYPCVTSHMDTVQYKHDPYVYAGVPLALKIEKTKDGDHKLSVDNEGGTLGTEIGIGADCKAGIVISLALFSHMEKLKACFFLDEETGCNGSDHMDTNWFKDVGYVIGFDSPDLLRAAWSCNGTKLFNYDFYEKWMKPVCDEWGWKNCFYSEPFTDVKNIREKTGIICMNFGNGGYNAHNIGGTEFMIMEDTDYTCGMAIDLIDHIGFTRHILKHKKKGTTYSAGYVRNEDGTWDRDCDLDDDKKLEALGDNDRRWGGHTSSSSSSSGSSSSSSSNSGGSSSSSSNSSSSSSTAQSKPVAKEDEIKFETVKYIAARYESHINAIKDEVLESIKELCASKEVDFSDFEKAIASRFSNEVKF